jgi:hypothetical protein
VTPGARILCRSLFFLEIGKMTPQQVEQTFKRASHTEHDDDLASLQAEELMSATVRDPSDITTDPSLKLERKRELLAHWASDIHAVANHPAVRRLKNGAVASIDELLEALKSLDSPTPPGPNTERRPDHGKHRILARLRQEISRFNHNDDDDDDPPPAPAAAALPVPTELRLGAAAHAA